MMSQESPYKSVAQHRRQQLIAEMATKILNPNWNKNVEELLLYFCVTYGVSKAKAKEYFDLAVMWNKMKLVDVGGTVKAEPEPKP